MMGNENRGSILITLLIAMIMLSVLVAAFTSFMSAKRLSAPLYVNSTQAFFIAQAGLEYGLRYATDNSSSFCTDPVTLFSSLGTMSFGNGTFTVTYDNGLNRLTSVGQVGYAKRSVTIDSFDSYLPGCECLTLDASYTEYKIDKVAYYRMLNNCGCAVRIFSVSIAKTGGNQARLDRIRFNSSSKWTGSGTWVSTDPASPTYFNTTDYDLPTGARACDLRCKNANQVAGTWYVTFVYRDCSGSTKTSTVSFNIP